MIPFFFGSNLLTVQELSEHGPQFSSWSNTGRMFDATLCLLVSIDDKSSELSTSLFAQSRPRTSALRGQTTCARIFSAVWPRHSVSLSQKCSGSARISKPQQRQFLGRQINEGMRGEFWQPCIHRSACDPSFYHTQQEITREQV